MADDTENDFGQTNANPSVASLVYNGLIQRGVKPDVAYGALGSLMGESGRNLNAASIARGDGSDGSDSLGFGQWNGQRAANLRSTADSMNLPWNSGQAQAAHLFNELDGKYGKGGDYSGVLKALQNGQSVADGNSIWTRQYEVPANVDAQVAKRLGYGNALAQGAQQGTLDLAKVGAMGPNEGLPNARSFMALAPGALSANNMAGGNGALGMSDGDLWNMVSQQDRPSWGDNLIKLGSIVAGINSPSQAQQIAGLASKPGTSQADKLAKFLQLKSAMQKVNNNTGVTFQGTLNDGTPYYTNQQGAVSDAQGNPLPNDFMTQHSEKDNTAKLNNQVLTGQSKNVSQLSNNASLMNEINAARDELVNNPEIAKDLTGLSSYKGNLANFLGESNIQSEFQKRVQRILNTYVYNASSQLGGRQTDKLRDLEKNMIAPNGAMNDSNTLLGVLNDAYEKTKNNYNANAGALKAYNNGYGEKAFPFIDPVTSAPGSLQDYLDANNNKWAAANDKINKGLDAFHNAHDIRTGKKKPQSFMDMFSSGN